MAARSAKACTSLTSAVVNSRAFWSAMVRAPIVRPVAPSGTASSARWPPAIRRSRMWSGQANRLSFRTSPDQSGRPSWTARPVTPTPLGRARAPPDSSGSPSRATTCRVPAGSSRVIAENLMGSRTSTYSTIRWQTVTTPSRWVSRRATPINASASRVLGREIAALRPRLGSDRARRRLGDSAAVIVGRPLASSRLQLREGPTEVGEREGLGEGGDSRSGEELARLGRQGVAGHEHQPAGQLRIPPLECPVQRAAVEPRHTEVAQDDVERAVGQTRQRAEAAVDRLDLVSLGVEQRQD